MSIVDRPTVSLLCREVPMALPHWSHDRKCFYKYMIADTAERVLQSNSLRWAAPLTFNDPFDVQFDLPVEYDRARVIDQALQNMIDLYMGRRHVPNTNRFGQGIKLLQRTAPGRNEDELRDKFRQSMNAGLDNAEKNMPKNHQEIREVVGALKL
jgi:hypothetical protein